MEILGYLESVFYDGNSKLPGGKYKFTILNIENGERLELHTKLDAKEEFVVGVIYRIEYDETNFVYNMILMYENMLDFKNKIVSHRSYNYFKNPNQYKVQIVKYVIFAVIVVIVFQILLQFIK